MNIALLCFVLAFVVLLLIGAPIYLSLLGSSLIYFLFHPEISMLMLVQRMIASLDSFVLIAVPMFMLSGNLMNNGGVTDRIFNFADKLFGHLKGGLAYVNVFASFLFSGMSGSALADVGGLGQIEIKAMKDQNYDDDLTIGVTGASSVMGPIVPPSIPMVVYGAVANVSVGALFLGGIVPGAIMAIVLCVVIYFICHKRNYKSSPKASAREIFRAIFHSFGSLLLPVIIMGSIWGGIATPTEAAMISIVYVLILLFLFYRTMSIKQLGKIILETIDSFVPSLTIVSACALFGWVLQFEHFSEILTRTILGFTSSKVLILLLLNVILLFMGMIMDATPVIMLMVPVVLPLSRAIGVHDVQMGLIVILNLMIGLLTPPIGGGLFMLATVTKSRFEYIVQCTYKWLLPLFICLLLVTFIPEITLWIPRLAGLVR